MGTLSSSISFNNSTFKESSSIGGKFEICCSMGTVNSSSRAGAVPSFLTDPSVFKTSPSSFSLKILSSAVFGSAISSSTNP